jgi:BlaI family transcriptional regulator, penicillinase repressor
MVTKTKPTSAELDILNVLWEKGASTVREVFETLSARKPTTYTTVLKFMQIMHEKGLVKRDEHAKAHIYTAVPTEEQTQTSLVSDLLDRAFRGSALKLVQHVLETKATSPDELAEIRRMINEAEKDEVKK